MTKRGRILMLLAVIFILGIAGCNKRESAEREDVNGQEYFNAKVTEVYDSILEVTCLDVTSGAVGEGAMVHVQRNVASANAVPDVKVGDEIRVVFSGGVMESYPLQLGTVWAIYALDEDGNVIAGESNGSDATNTNDVCNWGVALAATDVTPFGMTLVCSQSGGAPTGELLTGSEYRLYTKKAGEWAEVPTVISNYAWDMVAYPILLNDSREFELNWEWLYGELPAGTYRIGKEIMDFRESGDYDTKWYYAEFEIK